jgi:hypothetical protein
MVQAKVSEQKQKEVVVALLGCYYSWVGPVRKVQVGLASELLWNFPASLLSVPFLNFSWQCLCPEL